MSNVSFSGQNFPDLSGKWSKFGQNFPNSSEKTVKNLVQMSKFVNNFDFWFLQMKIFQILVENGQNLVKNLDF